MEHYKEVHYTNELLTINDRNKMKIIILILKNMWKITLEKNYTKKMKDKIW